MGMNRELLTVIIFNISLPISDVRVLSIIAYLDKEPIFTNKEKLSRHFFEVDN